MTGVENPFLTYYSPFSPTARRKLALRVFTLANVAAIAGLTWAVVRNSTSDDAIIYLWLLMLLYLSVMPQLSFFFFAPRNHTAENLEELLLTGLSKREVTWGYCYGAVILAFILVGSCMLAEGFAIIRFTDRLLTPGNNGLYHVVPMMIGLAAAGAIAISTGARAWMRHPNSVLRAFLVTPITILLQYILCGLMSVFFIWVADDVLPNVWENAGYFIGFSIPPIVGTIFSLRLTWRMMEVLLFREVDPDAYRHDHWLASRTVQRGEGDARAVAVKRLLALHVSSWKEIAGALLLTLLFWAAGGWAGRALHTQDHDAWNRGSYSPAASFDPDSDALTGLLKGLFGFQNLFAVPLFLALMIVLLVSRRRKDRLFPLLEGAVLGSVQLAVVPAACFSALQLLVTGVLISMESHIDWGEAIVLGVIFPPGIAALTSAAALLAAPRKGRMAWMTLLLAAALTIEVVPLVFMYHSSGMNNIVLLNMSKWGVAVPMAILSIVAWLLGYGIDLCGQRLHRLEVRDLPRFGFNIDEPEQTPPPPAGSLTP